MHKGRSRFIKIISTCLSGALEGEGGQHPVSCSQQSSCSVKTIWSCLACGWVRCTPVRWWVQSVHAPQVAYRWRSTDQPTAAAAKQANTTSDPSLHKQREHSRVNLFLFYWVDRFLKVMYTVKKAFRYSCPQPGCHLPDSPWAGIETSYVNYSCPGRVW